MSTQNSRKIVKDMSDKKKKPENIQFKVEGKLYREQKKRWNKMGGWTQLGQIQNKEKQVIKKKKFGF